MANSSHDMSGKLKTDLNDTAARMQPLNLGTLQRDNQTELRQKRPYPKAEFGLTTRAPSDIELFDFSSATEEVDPNSANAAVYYEAVPLITGTSAPNNNQKKKKVKTSTREKMRLGLAWLWFIISGFDYRKVEQKPVPEKTRKEKILSVLTNIITTVVSVSSGLITTVAVATTFPLAAPWLIAIAWAGYRVNFSVYKESIANTFKSIFIDGVFHPEIDLLLMSELPEKDKLEELPGKSQFAYIMKGDTLYFLDKQTGKYTNIPIIKQKLDELKKKLGIANQPLSNEKAKCHIERLNPVDLKNITSDADHTPISSYKKFLIVGGLIFSTCAGFAIAAITYLSVASTLTHILLFVGVAASIAAAPPLLIPIGGLIAVISFCAITALMFNTISNAIKQDAHRKVLNFCKEIFHKDPKRNISTTQHVLESTFKILFIAGGVALAILATITLITVWNNAMVDILTNIPGAHATACKIASAVMTFGFTLAARTPVVLEKTVKVFGMFGTACGTCLYKLGNAIAHPKETYKYIVEKAQEFKNYAVKKCTSPDKSNPDIRHFDGWRTAKFVGLNLLKGILLFGAVAAVVGGVVLNAYGNGAVSSEGGRILTEILGFFHIHLSSTTQNVSPFVAGSTVSVVFGTEGAMRTYIPNDGTAPSEQVDGPVSPSESTPLPSSPVRMLKAMNGNAQVENDGKKKAQRTPGDPPTYLEHISHKKFATTSHGKKGDRQPLLNGETPTGKTSQQPISRSSSWLDTMGSIISELGKSLSKTFSNNAPTTVARDIPLEDVTAFKNSPNGYFNVTAVI